MVRSITSCLLVSSLVLLAGCVADPKASASDGATDVAPAPLMNTACSGDTAYSFFHVKPDVPVEYISLRTERRNSTGWEAVTNEERGTPCATATDLAACKQKVDGLRTLTEQCDTFAPERGCFVYYFVATRGDEIVVAYELDEIKALIGRVDDPNEAITLATRARYQLTCGAQEVASAWVAVADGYELDLQRSDCTSDEPSALIRYKARVHVHADGRIEELSATEISRGVEPNACITLPTTR